MTRLCAKPNRQLQLVQSPCYQEGSLRYSAKKLDCPSPGMTVELPAYRRKQIAVAALHYDGTTTSMYNEFGDSTTTLADPLWHASVSTLGWRVDSRLGDLRPWAQISYNQQFGENIWKAQSGLSRMTATNQNGNWLDVTVGADMLLNQNIAAYAALSQTENTTNNSDYLYTMGVSARF